MIYHTGNICFWTHDHVSSIHHTVNMNYQTTNMINYNVNMFLNTLLACFYHDCHTANMICHTAITFYQAAKMIYHTANKIYHTANMCMHTVSMFLACLPHC